MNDFDKPYSIKFFPVRSRTVEKDYCTIHVRITLKREKREFSVNVKGIFSEWDSEEQRFNDARKHNRYLNNKISDVEGKMQDTYMEVLHSGYGVTVAKMKAVYRGDTNAIKLPTVLQYIEEFIEYIKLRPNEYTQGTINHYNTMIKHFKAFIADKDLKTIRLDQWRKKHFVQFESYLLTTPNKFLGGKTIQRMTSNKYLSKLKVIFNHALANELITHNPIVGFKMVRQHSKREYLSLDDVRKIENSSLGGNESLDRVRRIFLFSIYTGLRWSDAHNLKVKDVFQESDGQYFIRIKQQKTGELLFRPVLDQAVKLYKEFKEINGDSEYVLPRITNEKTNAYLKNIAELADVKIKLTHHLARHTFATTILLEAGVDLKATSFMLGHTSTKTTEQYAKISRIRAVNVISQLNEVYKKN